MAQADHHGNFNEWAAGLLWGALAEVVLGARHHLRPVATRMTPLGDDEALEAVYDHMLECPHFAAIIYPRTHHWRTN